MGNSQPGSTMHQELTVVDAAAFSVGLIGPVSFELDAANGYVTTSSLLRGTLAIYDRRLTLLRRRQLARATRDVAITPGWQP